MSGDAMENERELRGVTLAFVRRAALTWDRYRNALRKRGHDHGGRTTCELCAFKLRVDRKLSDLLGELIAFDDGEAEP